MRHCHKFIILLAASLIPAYASAESPYWEQKTSLYELLPINGDDIVFVGNSITDGGEFAELFDMPNIKNRGISSDVVKGVEKRIGQILANPPAKIFLLIGINDISHNLSASQIASEYERLVARIRAEAPSTRLYLQSVMPVDNSFGRYKNLFGREKVIPDLNAKIREIAEKHDADYIDLWPALADPQTGRLRKEFTNDGLHLTGRGYKAWTEAIRPFVKTTTTENQ